MNTKRIKSDKWIVLPIIILGTISYNINCTDYFFNFFKYPYLKEIIDIGLGLGIIYLGNKTIDLPTFKDWNFNSKAGIYILIGYGFLIIIFALFSMINTFFVLG